MPTKRLRSIYLVSEPRCLEGTFLWIDTGGFGNATRIDYGTGHELSFAAFLCCLCKLRVLKEDDFGSVVCRVFPAYLDVTRKLQSTYNMEPAGSQGVWGLDDFQFLPYIWGSSQLIGKSY